MRNVAPEQHWTENFLPALAECCHSCGKPYAATLEDRDRGVYLCPDCADDLTEQMREWLGEER